MSKHMLGRPGDLLGITLDFVSKLHSGAISPDDAKRWLRKEHTRQPIVITGELQKAVEQLVDRCDRSDKERYLAVVEFMLEHGIVDIDIVCELYNKICPEFRKDWSVFVGKSYLTVVAAKSVQCDLPTIFKFLYGSSKGKTAQEISAFLEKRAESHHRIIHSE